MSPAFLFLSLSVQILQYPEHDTDASGPYPFAAKNCPQNTENHPSASLLFGLKRCYSEHVIDARE